MPYASANVAAIGLEIESKLDHLTGLWAAIEGKILSMQPPRHIAYRDNTYTDGDSGLNYYEYLGLQRHGTKWRVCYGTSVLQSATGRQSMPSETSTGIKRYAWQDTCIAK